MGLLRRATLPREAGEGDHAKHGGGGIGNIRSDLIFSISFAPPRGWRSKSMALRTTILRKFDMTIAAKHGSPVETSASSGSPPLTC